MRSYLSILTRHDAIRGGLFALTMGLAFVLFHFLGVTEIPPDARRATTSVFVWLWLRWQDDLQMTWLACGLWIPGIALLLVWSRRRELRAAAGRASGAGLAFVVLALALHWAGARAQQVRLSCAAFALLAWAVPYFMAGGAVARRLAFPCAFLLLAVPLNFLEEATHPLRQLAVRLSTLCLSALGLNVDAVASQVFSRMEFGFRINLADPASGIHFLTALLSLVLALGFLRRWSARKLLLRVAALPAICVAANVARTVTFGLAGEAFGGTAASAGFPRWSTPIMFLTALGLFILLARAWPRRPRGAPESGS